MGATGPWKYCVDIGGSNGAVEGIVLILVGATAVEALFWYWWEQRGRESIVLILVGPTGPWKALC